MSKRFARAIHWFRRDLRITDNTSLNAACALAEEVLPVYVISDWKESHAWTGPGRQAFLCGCLESLRKNVESIGGKLVFRQGKADEELKRLIKETKADALFYNRDPDTYGREMEQKVRKIGKELGIEIRDCKDVVLHEPDEVLTQKGEAYRVYTPYGRSWRDLAKPEKEKRLGKLRSPNGITSAPCPALSTWKLEDAEVDFVEPGEKAARRRLKNAIEGPLSRYSAGRNTPAGRTTSRLSQDLRFGLVSIREVYERAAEAARGASKSSERDSFSKFIGELAWREFYMAILAHWPEVLEQEFDPKWRGMKWGDRDQRFERWCEGKTGFPFVDAGMRELVSTGFMHNRVRMVVAMFLTKDLRIDWRHGERFFMQHLVDGEIGSNNGGWQWSAGVGADAAPYFRIQNPWTQSKRYDPEGEYIKKWVPELADVDSSKLHDVPKEGSLADDYPSPMVDHKEEREQTLEFFAAHKEESGAG